MNQKQNSPREDRDFWNHLEKWQSLLSDHRSLNWENDWLENDWCKDCRHCCGPQGADSPFPMALLPDQLGPDTADNFYMLDANTACIGKNGCKAITPHGCKLSRREKPIACGLFPVVLINGKLYLYVMCPAVLAKPLAIFFELAKKIAVTLQKYTQKELLHISISLDCNELSEKYVDLHCAIFKQDQATAN